MVTDLQFAGNDRRGQYIMISIWFFIGISLAVNGALILSAGLYQLINPPTNPNVVLFNLHAGVWWGALLLVTGLAYVFKFSPWRRS